MVSRFLTMFYNYVPVSGRLGVGEGASVLATVCNVSNIIEP